MQATTSHPRPTPNPGVTAPPGGLGTSGWWLVTAAAIVVSGLLFWLAADPLWESFEGVVPPPAEPESAQTQTAAPPPPPPPPQEVVAPEEATWTLVDIEEAVKGASFEIEALIDEGHSELPEFSALESSDETRAARARQRFAAWGQIWRNRVAIISDAMPPEDACAIHAAMDPACRSLRSVLWTLESVAGAGDLGTAEERLDLSAEKLDLFLNPPLPEEDLEDGESTDEGDER